MDEEAKNANPYASPVPRAPIVEAELSFRDQLEQDREFTVADRRAWNAICILTGCVLLTTSIACFGSVNNQSELDNRFITIMGGILLTCSIVTFVFGPHLWHVVQQNKTSTED